MPIDHGVFRFVNGTKMRVTFDGEDLIYDDRIIYSDTDFRAEYRGALKDKHVPHGTGIITLNGGQEFADNWVDGQSQSYK